MTDGDLRERIGGISEKLSLLEKRIDQRDEILREDLKEMKEQLQKIDKDLSHGKGVFYAIAGFVGLVGSFIQNFFQGVGK